MSAGFQLLVAPLALVEARQPCADQYAPLGARSAALDVCCFNSLGSVLPESDAAAAYEVACRRMNAMSTTSDK